MLIMFYWPHTMAHEHDGQPLAVATSTAVDGGYMTERTYIADPSLYDRFVQAAPEWLVGGIPIAIAVMLLCRVLAEMLIALSKKTSTTADDKAAAILSKVSWAIAKALSWIGVGVPKAILEEKLTAALKQPEAKPNANGTSDGTLKDDIRIS
jgi:hypothetical protein